MLALDGRIQATRVGEKRGEAVAAAPVHECLLGHLHEVAAHRRQFGLFLGDPRLGVDDLLLQVVLHGDGFGVTLGGHVHLGLEPVELVEERVDLVLDVR